MLITIKKKGQEIKQDALYAGGKRARELERKRERLIRTQPKREWFAESLYYIDVIQFIDKNFYISSFIL